mgnify:CR=1 FL=1
MHGLPDQTLATAVADLEKALELNPPHLSWSQLTMEQTTELFGHPPIFPEAESLCDIPLAGAEFFNLHNHPQYS